MAPVRRWTTDENAPLEVWPPVNNQEADPRAAHTDEAIRTDVVRVKLDTAATFDNLLTEGRPFVMEGLDIGSCTAKWSPNELSQKIDSERMVRPRSMPYI